MEPSRSLDGLPHFARTPAPVEWAWWPERRLCSLRITVIAIVLWVAGVSGWAAELSDDYSGALSRAVVWPLAYDVGGLHMSFDITKERQAACPQWNPIRDADPPISAAKALAAAREFIQTVKRPSGKTWALCALSLVNAYGWAWRADFSAEPQDYWPALILPSRECWVLMDGSTVRPTVTRLSDQDTPPRLDPFRTSRKGLNREFLYGSKRYTVSISPEKLARCPKWDPAKNENPPLSARRALAISRQFIETVPSDHQEEWEFMDLGLVDIAGWAWRARFLVNSAGGSTDPWLEVWILMDGEVVQPTICPRENWWVEQYYRRLEKHGLMPKTPFFAFGPSEAAMAVIRPAPPSVSEWEGKEAGLAELVDWVLVGLKSEESEVRNSAVWSVTGDVLYPLREAYIDSGQYREVASILSRFASGDPAKPESEAALRALFLFEPPPTDGLAILLAQLSSPRTNSMTQEQLVAWCEKCTPAPETSVPVLLRWLIEEDNILKNKCAYALRAYGPRANFIVEPLLDLAKTNHWPTASSAVWALKAIAPDRAAEAGLK